ncbi:MAG TPA: 50S ribosomal protein L3 [bacterium]|nr:50S ribosomal protein L3 [bacterium]HPT29938.1 50S ribosomal protein L3 [bacterium]
MKFILGNKLNMTQVWVNDKVVAVTPVAAGPCVVTQIKNKDNDGYEALQLGFGFRKEKNIRKPQLGHLLKSQSKNIRHLREFRVESLPEVKLGDVVKVDTFAAGDIVAVTGVSKGKGFQGVVKRHGFHGFRKTHGNKDQERHSGSVGPKGPAHVFKGTRMGGHMGDEQVTTRNLEVVSIDEANNILYIKGALPGATNSLVIVKGAGELKIAQPQEAVAPVEVNEEVVVTASEDVVEAAPVVEETPAAEEAKTEEAPVEEQVENKEA